MLVKRPKTKHSFPVLLFLLLLSPLKGQNATPTLTVETNPVLLYPGEPCLFKVASATSLKSLAGKWLGKTIFFNQDKTKTFWYGIGGVSLKTVAGSNQTLSLLGTTNDGKQFTQNKTIMIGGKREGGENVLPDTPPGIDLGDKDDIARIEEDRALKREIFSLVNPAPGWSGTFVTPMNTSPGSPFGKKRQYSSGKIKVHEGVDYPAPIGTPINAINSGRVILARPMVYEGNLVVLDHGQGLLSLYFHLSEFKVSTGDIVRQGQLIGLCGKSGRATGPHLHLAVRWQGIYVSPEKLYKLELTNLSLVAPSKSPVSASHTDTPSAPTKPTIVFSASALSVRKGSCVTLTWTASPIGIVKLDGKRVKNNSRQQVCPVHDTIYKLLVQRKRGIEERAQVSVTVITKQAIFSLIENASQAKWKAGSVSAKKAQEVPFGGLKERDRGIVNISNIVKLEENQVIGKLLEISPQQPRDSILSGVYKVRSKIQKGDSFFTQIGLAANARGSSYTLQLWFRNKLLSEMAKNYTGKLAEWNVDLSEFAGKAGDLEIRVIRMNPGASLTSVYLLTPQIER